MYPRFACTLVGDIPSKKNAWKRTVSGRVYLRDDIQKDIDGLLYRLISHKNRSRIQFPINGTLKLTAKFYVKNERVDVDNSYTTLQDLLQKAKIIENDNQIKSFAVDSCVDKHSPRVELEIWSDILNSDGTTYP